MSTGLNSTDSPVAPSSFDTFSSILLILILSILCLMGVIFMVFGPMMRSEAWKRVDNYIFGDGGGGDCDGRNDDGQAEE